MTAMVAEVSKNVADANAAAERAVQQSSGTSEKVQLFGRAAEKIGQVTGGLGGDISSA
ncbi:MAG: hypothetical protein JW781_02595 [Deltaproteobacteria bacterium]|nr:hypothetical protein [Candidatus Anaeroferrophillacea bacterium]